MDVLYTIKFGFNRPKMLAITLCVIRQTTFLGIIAAKEFDTFYYTLFEIFAYEGTYNLYFLMSTLLFHFLITLFPLIATYYPFQGSKAVLKGISLYIKLFPYVFFIAMYHYCLTAAFNTSDMITRIVSLANIPFMIGFILFHQLINQSLKFRQIDFCNRRIVSYTSSLFTPFSIIALIAAGPFYSIIFCLVRSTYQIVSLYGHCEYQLPQRLRLFFALFTFYFSFLVILKNFSLVNVSILKDSQNMILIMLAGAITSWMLAGALVTSIWRKMLSKAKIGREKGDGSRSQMEEFPLVRIQNQIKILVQSFIEREKHLEGKPNNYEQFWQQFREIVFLHKLRCQHTYCICKKKVDNEEKDTLLYLREMLKILTDGSELFGKETRLKVLNIYLFIEIAKKPFKGYYQLMILKKQKLPTTIRLEVQNLVQISRQCFDQIFFKNKVQNQQLDLLKVISAEESISNLEELIKEAITAHINFLDIFTYSNVKMSQVEAESHKLQQFKAKIDKLLSVLAVQYSENPSVSFAMFVFFKFLEVYRSKQAQLKKLSGQHALKKRLLIRAQGDNVSSQKGIIYLDLIEQRGKILKMTRNVPQFFGYARQEMLGFNINLFMPTLFGKYHGKFLSNFVDKGRIKLLKQKNRMIFGKNKKKFIFPVYAQLKTEHLLNNQFGASGLLTPIETSSQFMIVGKNGKVEQITEGLYRKIFSKTLKDQVWKISRICAYKLLPALNQILQSWQQGQPSKIYEGLIVFTQEDGYLQQKFRHARQATYASMSYKTKTSSLSIISTNSISSNKVTTRSQRYEYFTELFKTFLVDIDPKRLKAFKVSFKYCKLKTSQFEVQQIEILSTRQQIQGKEYLRQILNEFNNIAQIFELAQEHSPISNHLAELEQMIDQQPADNMKQGNLELKLNQKIIDHPYQTENNDKEKDNTYRSASGSQDEMIESNQKKGNQQASDQNSMLGTTDSQSKRLILINAFNTSERALPSSAITCALLASIVLFALLIAMTVLYFASINNSQELWKQSSYLLSLISIFEFRLATAQILRFNVNTNLTLSDEIEAKQDLLSKQMVVYVEHINRNTSNTDISGGIFTFSMPITDPNKNITYYSTFPQAVTQISHYFLDQNTVDKDVLRYNYESLHQNFSNFYNQRFDFYSQQKGQFNTIMTGLLSVYSTLIFLIALSSIPIFLYFKKQEESVRGKLAFMNVKEIKKAISRLKILYDAFKGFRVKGTINKVENELHESKNQKEDDKTGNKVIKLTSQSQGYKQLLCRPQIYCLLFLFIVFFSNLSLSLQILLSGNNAYFLSALDANKLQNQLINKAPLLLNVYLSNLNRALQNNKKRSYDMSTINQTQNNYFKLLTSLSLPNYTQNSIAMAINQSITQGICSSIYCTIRVGYNLQDLIQIYKKRFNYWNPNNKITATSTTINQWLINNNIPNILEQFPNILTLSQYIQSKIDLYFQSEVNKWKKIGLLLAVILMPLNATILLIILRKYLNHVNQMVHTAEQLFMHFPAQVLIQNTYLTSYFNAKSKSGK